MTSDHYNYNCNGNYNLNYNKHSNCNYNKDRQQISRRTHAMQVNPCVGCCTCVH